MAAVFAVAMLYTSFCSTTCAPGFCPDQAQQSASHDCDMPSNHPADGSHDHGQDKPNCSAHRHPSVNIVKADGLLQHQWTDLSRTVDAQPNSNRWEASALALDDFWLSDLAPPTTLSGPLYYRTFILRI